MSGYSIDKKKIAKNTVMLYIRTGITMIISFYTSRVTLQLLGVDDYGLNNLVGSVVALFSFLNRSMGTAVQRYYSIEIGRNNEDNLKRVFSTGLFLHICIAIIVLLLSEVFAIFFLSKMNIPAERLSAAHIVFQISLVSLVLNITLVPFSALLHAREMFDKTAMIEIIQAILRLGSVFLLAFINYDKLITFSVLNFFVTIYYLTSIFVLAFRFKESHTIPIIDNYYLNGMLKFVSMVLFTSFARIVKDKGIVMVINLFFGLAINAAYAVAMQVYSMLNTFVQNFKQSIVPQLMASFGASKNETMIKMIDVGTKISAFLLLLISIPLYIEMDYLLFIWLETPPEHSVILAQLIIIGINFMSFQYFYAQGIQATGKIKGFQLTTSILFLLIVLLSYIGCKVGGTFRIVMYLNVLCGMAATLISLFFAKKSFDYHINYFFRRIFLPWLICIIITFTPTYMISLCINQSLLRCLIVGCLSTILCVSSCYFILLQKEERSIIVNLVLRKKTKLNC